MHNSKLLELYDLDGTLTTIDVIAALEGEEFTEVTAYIITAALDVSEKTGIPSEEVFEGIKTSLIGTVFPNRVQAKYWATFSASDGSPQLICPSVDHFLLVPHAIKHFLNARLNAEGPQSKAGKKIFAFLESSWQYPLFKHASNASLPHAKIEEDAILGIENRIRAGALAAVITNSSLEKATTLLARAGFGTRIVQGAVERRKIGAIGDAKKFLVDVSQEKTDENILDLSRFGLPVPLDLRRRVFQEKVRQLMASVGAERVFMATDIPELDSFPLEVAFERGQVQHGIKVNPTGTPESAEAARVLLGAKISERFSELVEEL